VSLTEELLIKTLILSNSKGHFQLSQHISTYITKLFREISKIYPQNITQKINDVVSRAEELKRARNAHQKNIDKYSRIVKDLELQLRARENIIMMNANAAASNNNNNAVAALVSPSSSSSAPATVLATGLAADSVQPSQDQGENTTTQQQQQQPQQTVPQIQQQLTTQTTSQQQQQGSGLMGRSLTKMLAKIPGSSSLATSSTVSSFTNRSNSVPPSNSSSNSDSLLAASSQNNTIAGPTINPAHSLTEKKVEERCRDLFKEIDIAEKALCMNADQLMNYQQQLVTTTKRTISELFEAEYARCLACKNNFLSYLSGYENAYLSPLYNSLNLLSTRFSEILNESENQSLLQYISSSLPSSSTSTTTTTTATEITHPVVQFINSSPEISENYVTERNEIASFFIKINRLNDCYDSISLLINKSSSILTDINDIDRSLIKNVQNTFEKHGFQRFPTSFETLYTSGNSNKMLALNSTLNLGQLLITLELPGMKAAFEQLILTLSKITFSIEKTLESCNDEMNEQLGTISKKLINNRKELSEKSNSVIKKLENQFTALSKTRIELKKLKGLLKERRATIKAAKDEGDDVSGVVTGGGKEKERDSFRDSHTGGGEVGSNVNTDVFKLSESLADRHSAADIGADEREEDHNNDQSSLASHTTKESTNTTATTATTAERTGRKHSAILLASTAVKLKQGLGIESANDRITRIENQISSLEDKEVELTAKADTLLKAINSDLLTTKKELESYLSSFTESLMILLYNYKSAIDLIAKLQFHKFSSFTETMKGYKEYLLNHVNIDKDIEIAKEAFSSDELDLSSVTNELLEIPIIEPFKPVESQLLLEGRQKLLCSPVPSSASGAPSLSSAARNLFSPPSLPPLPPMSTPPFNHPSASSSIALADREKYQHHQQHQQNHSFSSTQVEPPGTPEKHHSSFLSQGENSSLLLSSPPVIHSGSVVASGHRSNILTPIQAPDSPSIPPSSAGGNSISLFDTSNLFSDEKSSYRELSVTSPPVEMDSLSSVMKRGPPSLQRQLSSSQSQQQHQQPQQPIIDSELKKFGLSANDKVLESFSCALYPKKGILTHGR
jgi:hypothetical protein